MVEVSAWLVL